MKLSDQRLVEILAVLQRAQDVSAASTQEWISIAKELKSLRLRTSSQSRTTTGPAGSPASH